MKNSNNCACNFIFFFILIECVIDTHSQMSNNSLRFIFFINFMYASYLKFTPDICSIKREKQFTLYLV